MTSFIINKDKEPDELPLVHVYTFSGEQDFFDDDGFPMIDLGEDFDDDFFQEEDAYAIKISKGRKINYYVKRGKYGKLFNPIGMYSEGRKGQQMRHAGRPEWRFEPTNEKIFNYYINFLKTKNSAWLNNAEREI